MVFRRIGQIVVAICTFFMLQSRRTAEINGGINDLPNELQADEIKKIDDLTKRCDTQVAQIETLEGSVTFLKDEISGLKTEIENQRHLIEELQASNKEMDNHPTNRQDAQIKEASDDNLTFLKNLIEELQRNIKEMENHTKRQDAQIKEALEDNLTLLKSEIENQRLDSLSPVKSFQDAHIHLTSYYRNFGENMNWREVRELIAVLNWIVRNKTRLADEKGYKAAICGDCVGIQNRIGQYKNRNTPGYYDKREAEKLLVPLDDVMKHFCKENTEK